MTEDDKNSCSMSNQGEAIKMNEQEEDLICRMHRLIGERWDLIAGRIPGRTAEEIKQFWSMREIQQFQNRKEHNAVR